MYISGDYYAGEYHIDMNTWGYGYWCHGCLDVGVTTHIRKNTVKEMKARLCKDCTTKYNLDHIDEKERYKGIALLRLKNIL